MLLMIFLTKPARWGIILWRQVILLYARRLWMRDDTLLMTMLFDFFGELLTEKQREYYDLYHNEDLSLSEIAESAGISRQGVYDIITRAGKALIEMEQKTGVVNRWRETIAELTRAESMARELLELSVDDEEAAKLARELTQILEQLRNQ